MELLWIVGRCDNLRMSWRGPTKVTMRCVIPPVIKASVMYVSAFKTHLLPRTSTTLGILYLFIKIKFKDTEQRNSTLTIGHGCGSIGYKCSITVSQRLVSTNLLLLVLPLGQKYPS